MTSAVPPRRPRPAATPGAPVRPAPRPAPSAAAADGVLEPVVDEAALQARVDAFFAARGEDEPPARTPLRARLQGRWDGLRRDDRLHRRACVSAIGAGVALFVTACLTTPLAGADTASHRATRSAARAHTSPLVILPAAAPVAAPAVRKTVARQPTHAAKPAPVNAKAISGLAANGIPTVALNAYRVAAARLAHNEPGCGIDWAMLAGIGREESDHGRFGGAVLHADGVSTPAIVGPALDGVHWDYIPVSADYVRVTGDKTYAHALGPMQFIPTTWAAYGADADGDGKADVFDINDAALGTARYLCAAGGNLRSHAGQVAAVLAYNHSDQYLAQVLALADAYRRGVTVTGIPVGNTTGTLPTIKPGGYVPPANPGAPTAVDTSAHKAAAARKAAAKKAAAKKAAAKAAAKKAVQQRAAGSTAPAKPAGGSTHPAGTGGGGTSGGTGSGGTGSGTGGGSGGGASGTPAPSPSSAQPASSSPAPPSCTATLLGIPLC